jgi:lipid-A-disaccharide synthase
MKIAVLAAEASGDLLGADLIRALKAERSDLDFFGIGGSRMQAQGLHSWIDIRHLSVQGYVEVFRKLPRLLAIRKKIIKQLKQIKPDVLIGIDAPDFLLAIEKIFRGSCRVYHYVSPSVWAWRSHRIPKIGHAVDHLFCLFPHEPSLYQSYNISASFVGHPLVRSIPSSFDRDEWCEKFSLPKNIPIFSLLPGSRLQEIELMTPILLHTAEILAQNYPEAQFLVPFVTREGMECFESIQSRMNISLPLRKMFGHTHLAGMLSHVALVTSGTATLEMALCGTPMVITYKTKRFNAWMAKRKLKTPWVGLPNILLNKEIVPERLQECATPVRLAKDMIELYENQDHRQMIKESFASLRSHLTPDSWALLPRYILNHH